MKTVLYGCIIFILILVPVSAGQGTVSAYMVDPDESCDPIIVTDGANGAYLVFRGSKGDDGYIQLLDSSGQFSWEEPYTFSTVDYLINDSFWAAPDENGNLVIVRAGYQDNIFGLYAQKIDRESNPFWTENGIFITGLSKDQPILPDVHVTGDEDGGAIIIWQQTEYPQRIYAQKIQPNGIKQWGVLGKIIAPASEYLVPQCCFSDGKGGAIITWEGERETSDSIYAQRISEDGQLLWDEQGVKVSTDSCYWMLFGTYDQSILSIIDYSKKNGFTIAQLDANGDPVERTSGRLYPGRKNLEIISVVPADNGEIYIIWSEEYSGLNFYRNDCDLYAQKSTVSGEPVWKNPLVIYNTPDEQDFPIVCTDAAGGFIVAWKNYTETESELYIRRFDETGVSVWGEEPLHVDNVYSPIRDYRMIPNGAGGAILVREEGEPDRPAIFTQVIYNDGTWTSPDWYLYPNRPRSFRNKEPFYWPGAVDGRPNSFLELIVIFLAIPAGCFILIFLYNRVKKYLVKR